MSKKYRFALEFMPYIGDMPLQWVHTNKINEALMFMYKHVLVNKRGYYSAIAHNGTRIITFDVVDRVLDPIRIHRGVGIINLHPSIIKRK